MCVFVSTYLKTTVAEVVSGNDAGKPKFCFLKETKQGRSKIFAEDFFASSPAANLVSVTKKDTPEFAAKGCEVVDFTALRVFYRKSEGLEIEMV